MHRPGDEPPPPPELPVLEVLRPERGAFVGGAVKVSGRVDPGTGAVTTVHVDEGPVALEADNTFETTLSPEPGMLILGTRVEDDAGERAVDGRAVQVGPTHDAGDLLEGALALQIGPAMLDDDEPDLDDIAGVAQAALKDPAVEAAIVGTTIDALVDVTVTGFRFSDAAVDLIPQDGVLWTDAYLSDLSITFDTSLSLDGWATASLAAMQADVSVSGSGDDLQVGVTQVVVWLEDFAWGVEAVPGWAEELLAGTVREMIEQSVAEQAEEIIGTLLIETLAGFALDRTFGETGDLHLRLEIGDAGVAEEGLMLWLDGSVSAEHPGIDLPAGAGSLATPGPPPELPIATDLPLVVVADDDFVNQALFAFWHAGALGGWEMSGVELAVMTGEALPPPLGPVDRATLDVGLPPILSAPKGDKQLDVSIGELVIGIDREDGERVAVSISARAGADLVFVDEGLSVTLDDRPAQMTIHAGMLEWPEVLDPGDLASLFRLSTPSLLGRSSSLLPAFPSPELPIGEMLEMDAVGDLSWALSDAQVRVEPSGWLVLEGRMLPR